MPAFFNQQFINDAEAKLHVSDLSIQRGYAVFDFLRTVNAKPLFLEEHLNRFFNSAKAMHLQLQQSKEELQQIIYALIEQSKIKEAGIRLMLTGGYSADSYHTATPNLLITCNPVKTSDEALFQKGITAITHEHQRELSHIKNTNYLMAVWLHPLLKEKGADDVLYYFNNNITEFPRANVFAVTKENKLITPAQNILHGVTRKFVLQQAATFMDVEERNILIEELYDATEIFLTSTTRRVMPVLRLDGRTVGDGKPGALTVKLWKIFMQMENEMKAS